jgi:hypothetical protein
VDDGLVAHAGTLVFVAVALLLGAWAGGRGLRLLGRGLRHGDDPEAALSIVRGLRGIIVAVCAAAVAAGVLFEQRWLIVFAVLWLAEEIYETGVLALILRAGASDAIATPMPTGRWSGRNQPAARPCRFDASPFD